MFLVPFGRQGDLARSVDRLFDEGFDRFFGLPAMTEGAARTPALDLTETDRAYTVTLDLPGVAKDDVQVAIDGRRVSITAQVQRNEEKKEGERVVYRERALQSYSRSFMLPGDVDSIESTARLDQGVLSLTMPKRIGKATSRITVT